MDIDLTETINELESEMLTAANNLEFEKAALMRDQIKELKRAIDGSVPAGNTSLASYGKNRVASRGYSKAKRR
jgi:excinuclease ABC subunit B